MRNWHPLAEESHFRSMSHQSDITYEELTHYSSVEVWGSGLLKSKSSDITYEELTHSHYGYSSSYSVGHYLWGIDTSTRLRILPHCMSDITYEELTQNITSQTFICTLTSRTLPMRNWHTGYRMFQSACLIRRTLPMRNWHHPSTVIRMRSTSW